MCQKKHSEKCIEEFYKENVIQELKNRKSSPEEKKKMHKVLQKMREEDYEDQKEDFNSEKEEKLEKRFREILEKLNEKTFTLKDLTMDEQKEFAAFINNPANLEKHVKVWHPFWENDEVINK